MCLDAGSGELGVSRVAEKAGFRVWMGCWIWDWHLGMMMGFAREVLILVGAFNALKNICK